MRSQFNDGEVLVTPAKSIPPPIYSGPPTPTAYDDKWQFYANLTSDQIEWFQAQPEWAAYVATQPEINYGGDPAATAQARSAGTL